MAEKTFEEIQSRLLAIDVSPFVETKKDGNGKSYVSWANAWGMLLKECPDAEYEIHWFGEGGDRVPYLKTKEGYLVQTSVTICGRKRDMWLPVQDANFECLKEESYQVTYSSGKQKTIAAADMNDINKSIMRCLVKNIAMFGLGINVYQGEDVPNVEELTVIEPKKKIVCEACGKEVVGVGKYDAEFIANRSKNAYGKTLCYQCAKNHASKDIEKQEQKEGE